MKHEAFKKLAFEKNRELKAEYDALEPEYQLMRSAIAARANCNLTQKELAARIGTTQANISKLERGELNPSVAFLRRFANACGKKLAIEFC